MFIDMESNLDLIDVIQYLEDLVVSKKGFSSESYVLLHHALALINQVALDEDLLPYGGLGSLCDGCLSD